MSVDSSTTNRGDACAGGCRGAVAINEFRGTLSFGCMDAARQVALCLQAKILHMRCGK